MGKGYEGASILADDDEDFERRLLKFVGVSTGGRICLGDCDTLVRSQGIKFFNVKENGTAGAQANAQYAAFYGKYFPGLAIFDTRDGDKISRRIKFLGSVDLNNKIVDTKLVDLGLEIVEDARENLEKYIQKGKGRMLQC